MNLKYENIYADKLTLQIIKNKSVPQVEELFLNAVYSKIESIKLEGYAVYVEKENFGGFFSHKTQILTIEFKKSKIQQLSASFFIQANGTSIMDPFFKTSKTSFLIPPLYDTCGSSFTPLESELLLA